MSAKVTQVRPEVEVDTRIAAAYQTLYRAGATVESMQRLVKASPKDSLYADRLAKAQADYKSAREALYLAEEDYKGWTRFFMVPGGHIHASMHCATCNKNFKQTSFVWLPELSGLDEAAAVDAHGAILCTVCYPTAPVHWTNAYEEAAKAKKAAQCPGSQTSLDRTKPHRTGYYSGNWGICPECGKRTTLTKSNNLRAHKP